MSSYRLQVLRIDNVYTVCSRLLEMLPSKHLHNAFKRLKWKCLMDIQKVSSRLKKTSSKPLYLNFKSKDLKSSTMCLQDLSMERPQTSLWRLQFIEVLKTSSTGLWNIWSCHFTHSVKYWTVREITKSSSTFSATNISSNIVWLFQLHDTIQTKSNFGTKFGSIYLVKWEKRLVFRLSLVNLQRAKDGSHMFDAKYRYVFVVQVSSNRTLAITPH